MNETIQALFEIKSVRSFLEKPILEADKEIIVEAAIQVPTTGNHQLFIAKAFLVLIFLADCRIWLNCYRYAGAEYRKPGLGDLLIACADTLIAA